MLSSLSNISLTCQLGGGGELPLLVLETDARRKTGGGGGGIFNSDSSPDINDSDLSARAAARIEAFAERIAC